MNPFLELSALFSAHPMLSTLVIVPIILALLDVIAGSLYAIKRNNFRLDMLADFGKTQLAPFIGFMAAGILGAAVTGQGADGVLVLTQASLLPWYASQIASIERNISLLTGADQGVINTVVGNVLNSLFGKALPQGMLRGGYSEAPVEENAPVQG